ncbi:hypothetical protein TELCIR_05304 [Teladorsagia circumcincta]|uniref:Aminopeptidase N-like N-terminal domain-containing protein n=1 Tax=Teladorsagia circumcincta TaxID=45464 RepID=A0A2G9URH5_TELCI|nr:hypothetical protein TELCIR_05304 [Teladorsagia circumcincta]
MDVQPPAYESYEFMEELHARQGKSKEDVILVPLPTHTLPLHYDLHLDMTKFDQKMIRGSLTVHLESFGNSTDDEILFHVGPRVNIERIRLRKEGKRVYPKTLRREDQKKLARIVLKERLKRGRYLLEIEYNITICDQEGGVHCYYEMDSVRYNFHISVLCSTVPSVIIILNLGEHFSCGVVHDEV